MNQSFGTIKVSSLFVRLVFISRETFIKTILWRRSNYLKGFRPMLGA